jgi:serine/threonine-protein kinase
MTMDPERWRHVSQVAADALEREGAARTAYLDHACGGDSSLRLEVERILRGHHGHDALLDGMGGADEAGTIAPRRHDPGADDSSAATTDAAGRTPRRSIMPAAFAVRLPAELLERGARRLALLVLVYAVGFLAAYLVREATVHGVGGTPYEQRTHTPGQLLVATFVLVSLLVSGIAARLPLERVVRLGLVFEVVGSLGIALASYPGVWELGHAAWGVSWLCVWIMMFPLVIPAPPRSAALAAFASASMGPLAIAVWSATRGFAWPPAHVVLATTVPNFVCAALAWYGSQYIHRIGLELRAARRLGRYRLVAPLGGGGMGEVWIAEHDMLARPAALKLVRRDLLDRSAASAPTLARFEREAQITAALTSPHTVRLYDFGLTDDDVFYYVMELLEGLDLDRMVRQFGPMPPARAVHFLRQACDSLAEAHDAGLIHRDVKPSNLFVCRQGLELDFVKVLDFGIAAPRPEPGSEMPGPRDPLGPGVEVLGTPAFMAPEAARGAAETRSDLYALGCVGYWLVTGRPVFESNDVTEAMERHRTERPKAPSRGTDHQVSSEFDSVILDCLEKDPARRPASASALASRLADLPASGWDQERARAWWREHQGRSTPPS